MRLAYVMISTVQRLADEAWEAFLLKAFPDPKRRAVARILLDARNKAVTHKLLTGMEPTEEEWRTILGAESREQ